MTPSPSLRRCWRLLAGGSGLVDLLPQLHQHAIDVTGGACTLLFEHNPRNGSLHATSGYGLDELRTDPWIPGPDEAEVVSQAFSRRAPAFVADVGREMPDLAERLGTPSARLLPLARGGERIGLLVVGFRQRPDSRTMSADASTASDAFLTALELNRLRRRDELQRDLRDADRRLLRRHLGHDEPDGRARDLLPRREALVRRGPHVGLDSRSARPSPRAPGIVRSRATSCAA